MKLTFLSLLLSFTLSGYSQDTIVSHNLTVYFFKTDTAYKELDYDGIHYKVRYVYHSDGFFVPTTNPPGQPHYFATISVFKYDSGLIVPNSKYIHRKIHVATPTYKQIGNDIDGVYVEQGCFEDVPVDLVKQAIELESKKTFIKTDDVWVCQPKDSVWNVFNYSHENGNIKYDVDSSRYFLYKIEDISNSNQKFYYYFKLYSYGLMNKDGWSDLVGYTQKSYLRSVELLLNCKVTDTIPEKVVIYFYDKTKNCRKYIQYDWITVFW